jgi:hypothetical protein
MADTATETTTQTTTETKPEVLTLTTEELNQRVENARRAAQDEYKRKNPAFKPEEREEYDRLRKERQEAEQQKLAAKGEYEKAQEAIRKAKDEEWTPKYEAEKKRADSARARLENTLIDRELLSAASKHNAIDADDVASLLRGRVKLTEDMDGVTVYDSAGNPAYGKGAKPMTVDELVGEFLQTKKHLVRATQTAPGGGAGGGRTVGTGDTSALAEIDAKIKDAERRVAESRNNDTRAMNDVLRLHEERKRLQSESAA